MHYTGTPRLEIIVVTPFSCWPEFSVQLYACAILKTVEQCLLNSMIHTFLTSGSHFFACGRGINLVCLQGSMELFLMCCELSTRVAFYKNAN